MTNGNTLLGLELEGFQVFDKSTYIPFSTLTMLFGPNSAGKSSILDAIKLYSELTKMDTILTPLGNFDSSPIKDLLQRHWRKNDDKENSHAVNLSIGVKHTTYCEIDGAAAEAIDRKLISQEKTRAPFILEHRWRFTKDSDEHEEMPSYADFEILINEELLVAYVNYSLFVNLEHPVLSNIEKIINFPEAAKTCKEELSLDNGILQVKACVINFHWNGCNSEHPEKWLEYIPIKDAPSKTNDKLRFTMNAVIEELSTLIGTILDITHRNSTLLPLVVEASRTVPNRRDLIFETGELEDSFLKSHASGDPKYQLLAISLANRLPNIYYSFIEKNGIPGTYASDVNRALSDHLFLEQGYRLDYDFRLLLSKENTLAAINNSKLNEDEFQYIVELFLRDGKNRKHLLEDVGSGIGYLLPVLCAIFHPQPLSPCFIQQPELHIHPALQAAMGDVFIEASNSGKQLSIETHSEHILLRILKRIRQTHLQVNIAPELRISAEDVCVLYFDPSPDGTTTVKRLRITEDGEFMDRWPRGFFGERDQELLDE